MNKSNYKKPILRSNKNSVFLGVCGSLESLNINKKFSRLFFVISSLFGGLGIILYFLFSLFIQKKVTPKRFLGVFFWLSIKFNLEVTRLRFFGGLCLFFLAHYGLTIYLLIFLWMILENSSPDKRVPDDSNPH